MENAVLATRRTGHGGCRPGAEHLPCNQRTHSCEEKLDRDQRTEQFSSGLDTDRPRVFKVKSGGFGPGDAKRAGENKLIGKHLY